MSMLDDPSPIPISTRVRAWAQTLPSFAAEVVSRSDITRPHVHAEFDAAPDEVRLARSAIIGWTRQVGLPAKLEQDIILATDEAVSNVVEHAYRGTPGTLTVFAACTRRANTVRVIVSDQGLWRPPPIDPGIRGRGLPMMNKLADVFRLTHTAIGTTVILGWSLPS